MLYQINCTAQIIAIVLSRHLRAAKRKRGWLGFGIVEMQNHWVIIWGIGKYNAEKMLVVTRFQPQDLATAQIVNTQTKRSYSLNFIGGARF